MQPILIIIISLSIMGAFVVGCGRNDVNDREQAMNVLVSVWDGREYPPEDLPGPAGFSISPRSAYIAVAKSKRLSLKSRWACFADDQMYYIMDARSRKASPENARKWGVKVDGQTGDVIR